MTHARTGTGLELDEILDLTTADQHKALAHVVRHKIIGLLNDRAATLTQLAAALGVLKGSVGFHLGVLERAGLVRVVRTRSVRGGIERYYGRTARLFEVHDDQAGLDSRKVLLRNAAAEMAPAQPDGPEMVSGARARLRADQVDDFSKRLKDLLEQFQAETSPGEAQYGLVIAFYPTGLPPLPGGQDGA